jgi:hypothetical protein
MSKERITCIPLQLLALYAEMLSRNLNSRAAAGKSEP